MRKKLVLQRNLRKGVAGGPPHVKFLVVLAACLTILVILTHYLFKEKSEQVTKRPVPEQGSLTRELPRQAEQAPMKLPEPPKPAEQAGAPQTKPLETGMEAESTRPPETQLLPKIPQPSPAPSQNPPAAAPAPSQGIAAAPEKAPLSQPATPSEPAPKDLFPKKKAPSVVSSTTAQKAPVKPETKTVEPAPSAKPARQAEPGDYAIQVGSVYTDKSQAQAAIKDLSAKGYKAQIRPAARGGGYLVTSSLLSQSKAYTLLEQMKVQGLNNIKIIKAVPDIKGPAGKPVPQGKVTAPGVDKGRN
jgi:hypothetical protein